MIDYGDLWEVHRTSLSSTSIYFRGFYDKFFFNRGRNIPSSPHLLVFPHALFGSEPLSTLNSRKTNHNYSLIFVTGQWTLN